MRNPPRISVVTPSLNQGPFLEANIRTVLDQGWPDFEHIVVDGLSRDNTREVLERHSHLRWISEKDRNMTEALNKGFALATGDIIAWLNTDDRYRSGAFETAARCLGPEGGHTLILGDAWYVDHVRGANYPVRGHPFETGDLVRFWSTQHFLCQPAVFFRRSLFDEIGMLDETLDYAMDYEFFLRASRNHRFHYVPQILAEVVKHEDCKTAPANLPVVHAEMLQVSRRYWGPKGSPGWLLTWSHHRAERALQAAFRHQEAGRRAAALGLLVKAVAVRPWIVLRPTWGSILLRTLGAGGLVDRFKARRPPAPAPAPPGRSSAP